MGEPNGQKKGTVMHQCANEFTVLTIGKCHSSRGVELDTYIRDVGNLLMSERGASDTGPCGCDPLLGKVGWQ